MTGTKARQMIRLPAGWSARRYQRQAWDFVKRGGRRAVLIWHRRAGKDSLCLNFAACAAHARVGVYWHMLPTAAQGRKVVWDGVGKDGRKFVDTAFPRAIRCGTNKTEMKIELKNGSIWQVVGSDNYNNLIGANPVGVVFSEYALGDPAAWDYIRPILAENDGWAIFAYTPRGRNHGHRLWRMAAANPGWFCQVLTVDDTAMIPPAAIEEERQAGMAEELVQQEFYCSFDASLVGSYYGPQIAKARKEGRIGRVPHDPAKPVHTVWDIGIGDSTAIWFVQAVGRERRFIDYYEASGVGVAHYIRVCQEKAQAGDWVWGRHYGPHDLDDDEWGTGKSRRQTAKELGFRFDIVPKWTIDDGIQAARNVLPQCWFDETACERGIDALSSYRKEWDDKLKMFRDKPLHDWSSHGADAFRYFAVGFKEMPPAGQNYATSARTDFDVLTGM